MGRKFPQLENKVYDEKMGSPLLASGPFSSDRLIHYLSAARMATPERAATICAEATADPLLHQFGELLASPSIASLKGTDHHKHFELLRLFAHGTVDDYRSNPNSFPSFSDLHWKKLRMLTILSLAKGKNILHYSILQEKLALTTVREVEDIVLAAIYTGLIRAKMNQSERCVEVGSAVGRDVVVPGGVSEMISTLKNWVQRSAHLVEDIDDKINYIATRTAEAVKHKAEVKAIADKARKSAMSDVGTLMSRMPPTMHFDAPPAATIGTAPIRMTEWER